MVIPAGSIGPYTETLTATPRALGGVLTVVEEVDPAMPRNLRLVPGVGEITAQWDAPAEPDANHAGYIVQYRAVGDSRWIDWRLIVDTDARSTIITGLEGRAYEVRVASLIAEGAGHVSGSFTAPKTVAAVAARPPGPPRNLAAEIKTSPNDGSRRIEVSWDAPADLGNPAGILGYAVQYRKAGASEWTDWTRPDRETPASTGTTIAGFGSGNDYEVRVAAIGPLGDQGAYATSGRAQRPPTKPLNLTLTPGDGRIEATWDAPADPGNPPFGQYIVSYRAADAGTSGGFTLGWQQFYQTGTSRTFTGLTNGKEYQVRVSVFNATGTGASVILSVTPSAAGGPPVTDGPPTPEPPETPDPGAPRVSGPPRNLVLTPGDMKLTATWDPPEDPGNPPLTRYRVEIRANDTPAANPWIGEYRGGTTMVFDWALENGWPYTVRVWAENAEGRSEMVSATAVPNPPEPEGDGDDGGGDDTDPKRPPTAPRNLTLTPGDGIIRVSWDAPRDMGEEDAWIGYIVESRQVGERRWFEDGFYEGTSATVEHLENGETYEVRVTAFNKYGDGVTAPKRATPVGGDSGGGGDQGGGNDNGGGDGGGNQGGGNDNGGGNQGGGNDGGDQGGGDGGGNDQGGGDGGGEDQQEEEEEEEEPDRAPGAPRNLRLHPGDRLITVAWNAPSDAGKPALSRYELCYRASSGGSWTCWGVNGTHSTITLLTNGQSYQVRVTAVNDAGEGPAASGSATPRAE